MKNWLDDVVDSSPVASHVAYAGEIEFAGCTEDDRTGRTVTFLLRRPVEELSKAHPFSAHTRRRRGHAGTLFEVSLAVLEAADPTRAPAGVQSMMLLNWGSGPKGETTKFLLTFDEDKHPFLACQRVAREVAATRWMAVFVEVDDQSSPVNQTQRAALEFGGAGDPRIEGESVCMICRACPIERCICDVPRRKPKQQIKNSNLAAQFIKNPHFYAFLLDEFGYEVSNPREADVVLKALLMISSKAELDDTATQFPDDFDVMRETFVSWQQRKGIDVTQ